MKVSRAKRRWVAWQRYVWHTGTRCNHKHSAGIHRGMAVAYADVMFSNRSYPKGVRAPWMLVNSRTDA